MTQKPLLRAEGECACVAQMARAKIRGRLWPSPLQRARHEESQSRETLETSFSASLRFATALGLILRVGVLCCVVVGGPPRALLFRCDRPGRCARLGLFWRACELYSRSRGRPPPRTSFLHCARHGRCARLGRLWHACRLDCRSRGRPPNHPFFTALGMAAALGFLQRVGVLCCVVIGENTKPHSLKRAKLTAPAGTMPRGNRDSVSPQQNHLARGIALGN